jgi:hypothetical protein
VPYAVGVVLALLTVILARSVGFDRDRAFYPAIVIIVAHYYVLFAVMGGSTTALIVESAVMAAFVAVAVLGFKFNVWLVVAALAGHGVFDFVHGYLVTNPGVPAWWPPFCLAYDVTAAAALAWLTIRRGRDTTEPETVRAA